jgi:hypothetical protein
LALVQLSQARPDVGLGFLHKGHDLSGEKRGFGVVDASIDLLVAAAGGQGVFDVVLEVDLFVHF